MRIRPRSVAAVLTAAALLIPTPPTLGDGRGCHVRNETQGTAGTSLQALVRAARDGDLLRLRGTCIGGGPPISKDLIIEGAGPAPTLTGLHRSKVVRVSPGASVTFRGLAIANGRSGCADCSDPGGAGITNWGHVLLVDVVVEHNRGSYAGGGISNNGTMTIRRSIIRRNRVAGDGGGISSGLWAPARLRVVDSIIADNRADSGGGIMVSVHGVPGELMLLGTRVVRNHATGRAQDLPRWAPRFGGWGGGIFAHCGGACYGTTTADTIGWTGRAMVTIGRGSVVAHNTARLGGGLFDDAPLAGDRPWVNGVHLYGTVVMANRAVRGGGIYNHGDLTLGRGTTVVGNAAMDRGGGVFGWFRDRGASVRRNTPDDCFGTPAC